jgi:predicted Zn-dependent peptidase
MSPTEVEQTPVNQNMTPMPSRDLESRDRPQPIRHQVLDNGMVAIAVENPAAEIVSARIFVKAGTRCEPPKHAGLAHLLAAVMTKGTDKLSSMAIAERVESVGAGLMAETASDYFLMGLKTVSADFAEILHLAAHLLRSPAFPELEVDLERRLAIQSIRSQQEQPFAIAFNQLREAMYGEHPYARSSLGTEPSVLELTREVLQHYHQTYFRPDNMVISLSGRIDPEEAIALVEQAFGDWKAPDTPIPQPQLPQIVPQPRSAITPRETQQSVIMLGYLAASVRGNGLPEQQWHDYSSLKLLTTYLGNGLSSRLFVELREKRGLAYDVSAIFPTRLDASSFVTYMGTAPSNTRIAFDGLRREVDRLREVVLSPGEVQAAKNKLLGQYALGKQTNAQIAQVYGWYETLGLGIDFDRKFTESVAATSAEAIQQVARRYLCDPYVSLVGPDAAVNEMKGLAIA